MNHTAIISEWVHNLKYEDIPSECIDKAKEQLFNVVGAAIMGVENKASKGVVRAVTRFDESTCSTILGTSHKASPGNAAIANSFLAQIFEFEDWAVYSHSGASVVPTAMAMGEAVNSSGKEFLTALVLGNEIAGRTGLAMARGAYVGNSLPNHQADASWIAGRLLGLDPERLSSAVGLGCFLAMETAPIGFLTDAKGLINSFPAHAGIAAALMAENGVVGNQDILEHPAGYLATVSEFLDLNELTDSLGEKWVLPTLHSKPYPICGYNISPIHAALTIVKEHNLDHEAIEKVDVYAAGVTLYAGSRFHGLEPDIFSQIEAGTATHVPLLFDVPYPMAAAFVDGELTPRQYDQEHIRDRRIRDLASRISLKVDPEMHAAYYRFQYASRVEVFTRDGRVLKSTVDQMPGAPGHPFDVEAKFRRGAGEIFNESQVEQAVNAIKGMEKLENIKEFTEKIRSH